MKVMTNIDFARTAKEIALNYKTLYVMGCFGAPLNDKNKARYTVNHPYNKRPSRTAKIKNASSDTFGFDCVNLIKAILWGWNGNLNATYGGAKYCSNDVPDIGADGMMKYCTDVSTDFSRIEIGEAVHMGGHIGIYIGDGLAVECTPAWKDCVQITAVGNIGRKSGYNTRTWVNHGKLNFIDYVKIQPQVNNNASTNWIPGTYKLLFAKAVRRQHRLGKGYIVKVRNCLGHTKTCLTSNVPNDDAYLKAGTEITCRKIYKDSAGIIWGSYGNCWIVLCNADGSIQAKPI